MAIETLISKLGSEALGKAATKTDEFVGSNIQGPSFKEVLNTVSDGNDFASMLSIGGSTDVSPMSQLQVLNGEGISFTPSSEVTSLSRPETSEKVIDLLGEVNKGQMQMDGLVNHILYSGQKFSNQELLVIQAHVFHFGQMVELTVKVAEQGVSSVKSILNTQVGG